METRRKIAAETFAALFDKNPEVIVLYGPDGVLADVNPAATELTGFHADEVRGTTFRDHIPRSDRVRGEMAFEMARSGVADHFETTLRHKDGTLVPVEVSVIPSHIAGTVRAIFVQARDIAALRDAEEAMRVNQQRLRSLFEYHPDGIVELKATGVISRVNVAFESETGILGERIVGTPWIDLIVPGRRERAEEARHAAMRGEAAEHESVLLDRIGYQIEVQLKLVPIHSGDEITGTYAIFKNVSAQRAAERAVSSQVDRLRRLYLVAASRELTIPQQLEAVLKLGIDFFGFDEGYIVRNEGDTIVIHTAVGRKTPLAAGARIPLASSFARFLTNERPFLFIPDLDEPEWRNDPARATVHWRSYAGTQLQVDGTAFGALAFVGLRARMEGLDELARESISLMGLLASAALERQRTAERIEQLAFNDSLTGLPNRVLFADRIEQAFGAAKRYARGFAVMYLDLDHFKAINDNFGHRVGDEVLVHVARRLRTLLRESDTIARFGGDEFVILQPVVDAATDAADLARKVLVALEQPIVVDGREHRVATSIGIALYPEHATEIERLMELADAALYRAKREGRNRWQFVAPPATAPRGSSSGAARSDGEA